MRRKIILFIYYIYKRANQTHFSKHDHDEKNILYFRRFRFVRFF